METLQAICATLAPPECSPQRLAGHLQASLDRLDAARRERLNTFTSLLDKPPFVAACGGGWRRFQDLPQQARERVLLACADSRVPDLRSGFQAFKRLVLFLAYSAADGSGETEQLWQSIGYPGPRDDAALPEPLPLFDLPEQHDADVIIIGSGAGGSVVAERLARAGQRVVVLEAGAAAAQVPQRELEAFRDLYLESGLCASHDLGITVLSGACLGGGTTINWSTSLRLRPAVEEEWNRLVGGSLDLARHYDAIEEPLRLTPCAHHNRQNQAILDGCGRLQWSCGAMPRNASPDCGQGCGYCGFGCVYGNKRSTPSTFLRASIDRGAAVTVRARVTRVILEKGVVQGVSGLVGDAGRPFMLRAPQVVVAAGSLRTPGILARSGIRNPHLGRHLYLHPVSAVVAQFEQPVESWLGPMQSVYCDQYNDLGNGYGVMLETAPAHPGLMAHATPWRSASLHRSEMESASRRAAFIVLTRDRYGGHVELTGNAPAIHYHLSRFDADHLLSGLARCADMALAAGATRLMSLHTTPVIADNGSDFDRAVHAAGAASNRLGLYSAHQMGTARMRSNRWLGVTDSCGRVFGARGLWVADASLFPCASGVNPMLTIMALAHRVAEHMLGTLASPLN